MRLVLVGVPGSGKSTVIAEMRNLGFNDFTVVDFGKLVLEESKKYGIGNRDDLRKKLTPKQSIKVQEKAAKRIGSMKGNLIIDTHASINTPFGYLTGLPDNVVNKIKPDVFVLLEFNPYDILKRRKSDGKRKRDDETEDDISSHQDYNRSIIASAATESNSYVKIIRFKDRQKKAYEHSKTAAKEIIKVFGNNK